jgi:hypothetical protein
VEQGRRIVTALPGEEMNDATELPEQLSTLLELHVETILQKRGASIMRSAGDRRGAGRLAHGVEAA